MMRLQNWICAFSTLGFAVSLPAQKLPGVRETAGGGDFSLVENGRAATILCDTNDFHVVRLACDLFAQDVERVTGVLPSRAANPSQAVIVGTLEKSGLIREAIESTGLDVSKLEGQWESYHMNVVDQPLRRSRPEIQRALLIIGSDRRGAAYGVLGLSEAIGVSPWYWWADVPPAKRSNLFIAPDPVQEGPPSVKFRGIFINDEDWGLQPWAARNYEPETGDIGPKTYAAVFELMLRLRANYCWPAMHECTKAFNHYAENKRVADDYAIVMGAAHCEPMLRNNVTEWNPGTDGDWNYVTNAERIKQYWDERLISNGMFENVYTVGMRGIHDSGMPGSGTLSEKARRLETIINDQRTILTRRTGRAASEVPQIFCPYKEVLNIYRTGMALPEDITIAWADDNHGYIRQLSSPDEQMRSGRSGVYYHLSYYGLPEDYQWLSSISPSLIAYEMSKAFEYGADRLWVFNVGDIKPAEKEITFAMELAWDIDRWTVDRAVDFPRVWAGRVFGEELAEPIGSVLEQYYLLAQRGKPEHIDRVSFTSAERAERLAACRRMADQASTISERIPARFRDAYSQLVYYPVTGAALLNEKHLLASQSWELARRGDRRALELAAAATRAHEEIQRITRIYNEEIAGGKWRYIMDWRPRDLKVFDMPAVATEDSLAAGQPELNKQIPALQDGSPDTAALANALVTVAGRDFSGKSETAYARIAMIPGLGNGAVTIEPVTAPSVPAAEAAAVQYDVALPGGPQTATFRFLPTAAIHDGRDLRAVVQINDEPAQVVNLHADEWTPEWSANVLRGYSEREIHFDQSAGEATRVEVRFPDPGLVLLTIDFR